MKRPFWRGITLGLCLAVVATSWAAPDPAHVSRALFRGIALFNAGRYAESLPFLREVSVYGSPDERVQAALYLTRDELQDLDLSQEDTRRPMSEPPERAAEGDMRLRGHVREQAAYQTSAPTGWTQVRSVGYAEVVGRPRDWLAYKASGRLWFDAVYSLTDRYPRPVVDDQRTDGQLRDTFVDVSLDSFDVRLGKQQVVWGEAIALFYADVVNAKDLREFILPDFEFLRTPEWAADLEYHRGPLHGELVWIPFPEMDRIARPGADFAPAFPLPPGTPVAFQPEEKPADQLKNSQWGGKVAYRGEGWDASAFFQRSWQKTAVYQTVAAESALRVTPIHPRLSQGGITLTAGLRDAVLKAESVFSRERHFQDLSGRSPDGLAARDTLDSLVGIDYVFRKAVDASLQLSQRWIPDFTEGLYQQRAVRYYLTARLKTGFFDNRLEPEVTALKDLSSEDAMLRPKLSYKATSRIRVSLGWDGFAGRPYDLFGQFNSRDRVYSELRYDF